MPQPSQQQVANAAIAILGGSPGFVTGGPSLYATKPPATSGEMVAMGAARTGITGYALACTIELLLRENSAFRTARAKIDTYNGGTTYTVTVDGTAFDQLANTDIPTTMGLLRDAINVGISFTGTRTIKGRLRVDIGTYAVGTTYAIELDGVSYSVVAAGSGALTAAALMALINGGAQAGHFLASVTGTDVVQVENLTGQTYEAAATATASTGTIASYDVPAEASVEVDNRLKLVGTSPHNYTVAVSYSGATGRASLEADATTATICLWGVARSRTVPVQLSWAERVVTKNGTERLTLGGGYTHAALQVIATDGRIAWAVGPCDLEA